jgi:hypothetical protein
MFELSGITEGSAGGARTASYSGRWGEWDLVGNIHGRRGAAPGGIPPPPPKRAILRLTDHLMCIII